MRRLLYRLHNALGDYTVCGEIDCLIIPALRLQRFLARTFHLNWWGFDDKPIESFIWLNGKKVVF
jgi:hypothetical protein